MIRRSEITVSNDGVTPRPGVYVTVKGPGGTLAAIYNDAGTTIANPLISGIDGTFVYNVADNDAGAFTEEYRLSPGGAPAAIQTVTLNGQSLRRQIVITGADGNDGIHGDFINVTNPTAITGYAVRRADYVQSGIISSGNNNISDTLLSRYNSITSGSAWGRWDVVMSPLSSGSGLPGAPASAQSFALLLGEGNPQNRHGDGAWAGESRRFGANWVGGYQMVPETQDFTGLLGVGVRRGYKIAFGYLLSRSPFTNSDQQRHATFHNGLLVNPNSIAPNGAFAFAVGYRSFPTAIAVSAAGSGYAVGDQLIFNSGTNPDRNDDTVIRVKAVNGSGGITSAEIYTAGWYRDSFPSPVGVVGFSGTGATFTYTFSSDAVEAPRAWGGIAGTWLYGLDAAEWVGTDSEPGPGHFLGAMFRAPNAEKIIVGLNAAGNADINGLRLTAADEWEFSQTGVVSRFKGNLTAIPQASATPLTNGEMTFELTSNTQLKIKVKGSDGTVRSTSLTLA